MPILTVTKTYLNNNVLSETDLDNIRTSIETFFNFTKLDGTNINSNNLATAVTPTGANSVMAKLSSTGMRSIFSKASTTNGYRLVGNSSGNVDFTAPHYVLASSAVSTFSGTSSSVADITNATITITAKNRPLLFTFQSTSFGIFGSTSEITVNSTVNTLGAAIYLTKDGLLLEEHVLNTDVLNTTQYFPCGSIMFIDPSPGQGSKTYKFQYRCNANNTLGINNVKMLAVGL